MPHGLPHFPTPPPTATGASAATDDRGYDESRAAASDFVTGLAPRAALEARLARALPSREPLAMAIIDVVGLKTVNERDGFLAGDTLLRAAADRLRATAADAALLARLGGDELVAVFLGDGAAAAAERAADDLAAATQPALRAAALAARPQETAAELVERLYATLRRC